MAKTNDELNQEALKTSVGWIELADLESNPTDKNADRRGLAVVADSLKLWNGTSWTSVGGTSATGSLDEAYNDGRVISVDNGAVTMNGVNEDTAVLTVNGDGDSAGALLKFSHTTNTRNDILGTGSTWAITGQGAATLTAIAMLDNQLITFGTGQDATIGWNGSALNIAGVVDFDNNVTLAASATIIQAGVAGSAVYTITAGDVVWSDASLLLTDADNAETVTIINNTATTIGASATAGVVQIESTSLTTGALLNLQLTEGTLNGGWYLRAWDVTAGAAVFSIAENGSTTIAGGTAGTDSMTITAGDLFLSDTDGSIFESEDGTTTLLTLDNKAGVIASDSAVLLLDAGGAVASGGNILRIAPTGTPNAGAIGIEFVGAAKALNAMYIDADPTANDVVTIHGGGALTSNNAVLTVSSDGAIATGGNTFRVEVTGTPASGAIYAELDYTGITDTNENIGFKIDAGGKKVIGLHVDADPIANDVVYLHSDAVIASDKAVLNITSAGAVASGGNILRIDVTGTPAAGAVYAEFDFAGLTDTNENVGIHVDATSKKVQALKIDAAPLAGSTALVTSTGALAADKATAELVSNVASCNADSAVLRVSQASTTGVATCVALVQADLDIPFITFEGTIGTGNSLEAVASKTLTTTHFIMVDIEGVGSRYIQAGTIA